MIIIQRVQIFTTHIQNPNRVTKNTNLALSKLDKFMDFLQHGHDAIEAMITSTSHKNSKIVFIAKMAWRSLFIFTTNGLYFSRSFLLGDNIEIHLVFMLCNDLFPFIFNNLTNLHYLRYLLGEDKKKCMWRCNSLSSFCTKGCLKNVCIGRLVLCVTQWTTSMKVIAFMWICVVTIMDTNEDNNTI